MAEPREKSAITERFWSYVDRSAGPDACWRWTGGSDRDGYGRFYVDSSRRCARANRFSLEVDGRPPEPRFDVAHSCDNPACVNPAHLSAVPHRENMRQMGARGRHRGGRPRCLTEAQVRTIWERRAEGYVTVARDLGVSPHAAKHVVDGSNWSHVTGAVAQ